MVESWSPEHSVDEVEAKKLIEMQFPEISISQIKLYGRGFDNTVFKVNNEYVFRFPRREIAVELLETEHRLLPRLGPFLPVNIPVPVFRGEPANGYPWPFLGYRDVNGDTPGSLTPEQRIESAEGMADFLKILHGFPDEEARVCRVPFDQIQRLNIGKRKLMLIQNIEKAKAFGALPEAQAFSRYAKNLQPIKPAPVQKLVHGDLHFRNIVVDHHGKVCGVIDWGDTHLGHPAVDLSFVYAFFPEEGRKAFFQRYGQIDEETEYLAQFKAIYTLLLLLLYGVDQHNPEIIAGAQEGLLLASDLF